MVLLEKAALDDSQISSRSLFRELVMVLEDFVLHVCASLAELREARTKCRALQSLAVGPMRAGPDALETTAAP